jgi:hypothetical protein
MTNRHPFFFLSTHEKEKKISCSKRKKLCICIPYVPVGGHWKCICIVPLGRVPPVLAFALNPIQFQEKGLALHYANAVGVHLC